MAILQLSKEFIGTDYSIAAIRYLKKENNAKITKMSEDNRSISYFVEGDDIPNGTQKIDIQIKIIVPNVFSISIKRY